jgi:voltage-gated potassium channel Kch
MGSKILEEIRDKKIIVVDYNPDIIEWLKAQKIDCIYGDVYNENVIEKLPLKHAKILIITIPDEEEVTNLINKAQDVNPNILIVAKAETIEDAITLYDLGADFVVLPEFVAGERICHFIHHIPTKIKQVEKYRKLHLKELEKELKQRGGLYASHLMKKILRLKK